MRSQQRQKENMKVVVRVRPLSKKQTEQIQGYDQFWEGRKKSISKSKLPTTALSFYSKYHNVKASQVIKSQNNCVSIYDQQYKNSQKKMRDYVFSQVFESSKSNIQLYNQAIKENVKGLFQGINCTILAYGITGSGKTFSVFGHPKHEKDRGICHLSFEELVTQKKILQSKGIKMHMKFSFLQIYNQNIIDLLSQDGKKNILIGEDSKGIVQLTDACQISIKSNQQIINLISVGTARRTSAATQYNLISSRSHAVLKMNIQIDQQGNKIKSKLFIIDLAGSEKIYLDNSTRKHQGSNINKSLLSLGNCINALVQKEKKTSTGHIPYRDSKLTRLLKDSLGGNARTIMIACISPHPFTLQQTVTTLNYAERAQGIRKEITKNITNSEPQCLRCLQQLTSPKIIEPIEPNPFQTQITIPMFNDNTNEAQIIFTDMFERLYNDVIQNVRQAEKIMKIGLLMDKSTEQFQIIRKDNQEQRLTLKKLMMGLFKQKARCAINTQQTQRNCVNTTHKKKIRLSNSAKKRQKQTLNDKQNEKTLMESEQKIKNKETSRSAQQGNYTPLHSPDQSRQFQSKIKAEQKSIEKQRQSMAGQKRKRSKFQIVPKPPNYQAHRLNSTERILTEYRQNNQQFDNNPI